MHVSSAHLAELYSLKCLEGEFSEVQCSMARRGRWARYDEHEEAVEARFGAGEARHETRKDPEPYDHNG
jgi:hypothetical protein